jgi:hypothetical protein
LTGFRVGLFDAVVGFEEFDGIGVFASGREQEPGAGQVIVGPAAFQGHLFALGRHFVCKMLLLKLLRISNEQIRCAVYIDCVGGGADVAANRTRARNEGLSYGS